MPFILPDLSIDSIEGIFAQTFVEKYQLSLEWNDAGWSWGAISKETGLWGDVVGMVRKMYNVVVNDFFVFKVGSVTSDVWTASICYKAKWGEFVDYSPAVGKGELEVIKIEVLIFPYLLLFVGTFAGCVVFGLEMLSETELKAVDAEKGG